MEAHSGIITGKNTKSFQKQRTEHKTDIKADRKAQDQQEKCVLYHKTRHIAKECKAVKPSKPQQTEGSRRGAKRIQEAA